MKTSWNELRLIEGHLLSEQNNEDSLLVEAKLILQPDFREQLYWQKKTYEMVQQYGRLQLRKQIEQVHQQLFTAPEHLSFRQKILKFFS